MSRDLLAQTLEGKVAIVTGSSRGLGADMAMDMARRGAKVVVTYISPSSEEKAAKLVSDIKALPNNASAIHVRADLGDITSPAHIVKSTTSAFGPDIHILVNNAALQVTKSLSEIATEDYERLYNVNIRGAIFMTQAVLPHLRPQSRIINISSVGGRAGFASLSLYTSSKAALEGFTRSWAAELGGDGTTVNAVAPGPVQSEMLNTIPTEIVEMQKANTPVGKRVGESIEVARVVSWLASNEASWVSGQVINVSGGWTMY
ncbi:uncharacterized protein Z518_01008 [Rhinocladiella mackenziei CBS 650.93]|uniref:Rhinocladiella mackenziei CBS 650.93 unplaced genomic scaffold supercont1.1, whole genome shotgun sequence n=1 Tax=Rhinocladiella mackenziei CBS 650.93 TaxID=1442369 RepID=A0A0D2G582_9EURO|nr:uncharacterized protein Z518_01008 [Rhinocladiella mackenziei CBS 650.93]KIX09927.1 hypothetical protein Z518_01008 [Rhinocladiella mackenziei CBS 650.93]